MAVVERAKYDSTVLADLLEKMRSEYEIEDSGYGLEYNEVFEQEDLPDFQDIDQVHELSPVFDPEDQSEAEVIDSICSVYDLKDLALAKIEIRGSVEQYLDSGSVDIDAYLKVRPSEEQTELEEYWHLETSSDEDQAPVNNALRGLSEDIELVTGRNVKNKPEKYIET